MRLIGTAPEQPAGLERSQRALASLEWGFDLQFLATFSTFAVP